MYFIAKGERQKDTTKWNVRNVVCFNYLRGSMEYEKGRTDRIGTFVTEEKHPRQSPIKTSCLEWDLKVLRKAIRVIPLLKNVKLESAYLDRATHPNLMSDVTNRKMHSITVSTNSIPADEALTAIFIARDILNGSFRFNYARVFGGVRGAVNDIEVPSLLEGYKPHRFWRDNKYFTAILYYVLAFNPCNVNVSGFFNSVQGTRPDLSSCVGDGIYWTRSRTSLFSVLAFANGTVPFVQEPISVQNGYQRDHSLFDMRDDDPVRVACTAQAFRRYSPYTNIEHIDYVALPGDDNTATYFAISNLMTVGEKPDHFRVGNRYAIENFLTDAGTDRWHQSSVDVLNTLDRLVDILQNG